MLAGSKIRFPIFLMALVLLTCWLTIGCGPVNYVNQVTRKASAAVASAKAARAEKYSPYWYTLAVEYLRKAREEASFADYEAANRFGRKATEAAQKAKKEAIARAADPSNTDWLPPGSLRSTGDVETTDLAPADTSSDLAPVISDDGKVVKPEPKKNTKPKSKKTKKNTKPKSKKPTKSSKKPKGTKKSGADKKKDDK